MRYLPMKAAVLALVLGAALVGLAGTASASHVVASVTMSPQRAVVGRPADIQVSLRSVDSGAPLAGVPVSFYMNAAFAGVEGKVLLGTATTDAKGLADLNFEPRVAGDHQVSVEYTSAGEAKPEVSATSISVAGSSSQLYRSTAGVKIPGLGVWVLIAVVGLVWAILLSVALRIFAIAGAGDADRVPETRPAEHDAEHAGAAQAGAEAS